MPQAKAKYDSLNIGQMAIELMQQTATPELVGYSKTLYECTNNGELKELESAEYTYKDFAQSKKRRIVESSK